MQEVTRDTTQTGPYATAVDAYWSAGWRGILPVGSAPNEKFPPPARFTGHGNPDPSYADVMAYSETHGDRNIALRLPAGVIGLDVDAYGSKIGAAVLAELVERFGPLPDTWTTGARTDGVSGIRLFRVPTHDAAGVEINWPGEAGKNIEIVQHGHRYAIVWPSTNPEAADARYEWRHAHDVATELHPVPSLDELAWLPAAWVDGLRLSYERTDKSDLSSSALGAWWALLRTGPGCPRVVEQLARVTASLRSAAGSRHEAARDAARVLAAYGGEGHAGAPEALLALGDAFVTAVTGPGRDADAEWRRLLVGAVELAATDNPAPRQLCACSPPVLTVDPSRIPSHFASASPAPAGAPAGPSSSTPMPAVSIPDQPPEGDALTDAVITQQVYDELLAGRYCWSNGFGWLQWDGRRWRECADETVVEQVRLWAVAYVPQQLGNLFIAASREMRNLLVGLLSKYRLTSIVALARGLCQVDAAAFDSHADLLNTPSGIVDLRTGELGPHDPALRMTRITAVPYDPAAEHADWTAALSAVRPDVADWFQVRFGQSITGHMTPDDVLLILRGGGENGKSTILAGIKRCVGDYGIYVSDRVLLADANAHPTELTDFRGARFTLTEELPDEARLNVKRLKDVVGTPTMKARKMRQDTIEWSATHSLFISTNPLPIVTDTDHGTWRRLALVEFPYTYVSREPNEAIGERRGDPGLRDRVAAGEAQQRAVLRWLVDGARRWYQGGRAMPPHPESVRADTDRWRGQSDPIEGFWNERLRPDENSFITSADMLTAFNAYLIGVGQREWSARKFNPLFGDHRRTKRASVVYSLERVKPGQVRSYIPGPALALTVGVPSPFVPDNSAVGSRHRGWWGVRFATPTDLDQD